MKALILINSQKKENYFLHGLPRLVHEINSKGYITEIYSTQKERDAILKISKSEGIDLLVVSGGDGTIYEATNGIKSFSKKPKILYFPTGTVNDLAYSLKISHDFEETLNLFREDKHVTIDIGKINDGVFNYVASFGPFTNTSYSTSSDMKNILGPTAYVLNAAKDIPNMTQKNKIKITIDDNEVIKDKFVLGFISNSSSVAGVRNFFNENDFCDGYFQLILTKAPQNIVTKMFSKTTKDNKNTVYRQFKKLKIETKEEINWSVDGEKGPVGSIEIEVLPQFIEIYSALEINRK